MTTSLSVSVNINKDINTVFSTICDGDYIRKKLQANGARNVDVQSSGHDGASARLVYTREEAADVPSAFKKFISEWNQITSRDNWTGTPGESYHCTYQVEANNPVKISGRHTLEPNGSGTTSTIYMDISCRIPLVGKKLEKFVAGLSQKSLQEDVDFQKLYMTD